MTIETIANCQLYFTMLATDRKWCLFFLWNWNVYTIRDIVTLHTFKWKYYVIWTHCKTHVKTWTERKYTFFIQNNIIFTENTYFFAPEILWYIQKLYFILIDGDKSWNYVEITIKNFVFMIKTFFNPS